jgi:hypothetical protein
MHAHHQRVGQVSKCISYPCTSTVWQIEQIMSAHSFCFDHCLLGALNISTRFVVRIAGFAIATCKYPHDDCMHLITGHPFLPLLPAVHTYYSTTLI